jgi:hypothetical protein
MAFNPLTAHDIGPGREGDTFKKSGAEARPGIGESYR